MVAVSGLGLNLFILLGVAMPFDSDKPTTRRQFLKGRAALQAARELLPQMDEFSQTRLKTDPLELQREAGSLQQASHVVHYSKRAMGCQFQFLFNATQYPLAADAVAKAFDVIESLEGEMSIYRSDSAVARLNQAAVGNPIDFSRSAYKCFELAVQVSKDTGGAFDISSGTLTELWGFEARQPLVPDSAQISEAAAKVDYRKIRLHPLTHQVSLQAPGMRINLGGIGKGHALDVCTSLLLDAGIHDFVIHGGQSSISARGIRKQLDATPGGVMGWTIGLTDPLHANTRLRETQLFNRCMGTSGSARQALFHQGNRLSHIIDPRTGWPGTGTISSTVFSDSAAKADAIATAFCVMELAEINSFCQNHSDISAVIMYRETKRHKVEMETFNME